jgi:hypothetical protein
MEKLRRESTAEPMTLVIGTSAWQTEEDVAVSEPRSFAMSEQESQIPSSAEDRAASLHAVARALRETPHLGRQARQALADFLDALNDPETTAAASPADMNHLTSRATQLLTALRHQHDAGVLTAARDGLEEAVVRVESEAPVTAGAFRRLLDALANIGL